MVADAAGVAGVMVDEGVVVAEVVDAVGVVEEEVVEEVVRGMGKKLMAVVVEENQKITTAATTTAARLPLSFPLRPVRPSTLPPVGVHPKQTVNRREKRTTESVEIKKKRKIKMLQATADSSSRDRVRAKDAIAMDHEISIARIPMQTLICRSMDRRTNKEEACSKEFHILFHLEFLASV